jgi:hypothetical protein
MRTPRRPTWLRVGWRPGPGAALMGVWFAIALHGLWAGLLLFSDQPKNVTAVYALAALFPDRFGLAIVLVSVAGCALYGILRNDGTIGARIALLLPQQLALGVSAAGAVHSMLAGQYADGVARSHVFLTADQAPAVLALFIHSATIIYLAFVGLQLWSPTPRTSSTPASPSP